MSDPAPYYKTHIFCCTNRRVADHARGCCAEKNAESLRGYMKDRAKALGIKGTRVNNAGCLDRCELGPVMVIYPEGVWYTYKTTADIDEILQTHLIDGKRVARLILQPQDKFPPSTPKLPPSAPT